LTLDNNDLDLTSSGPMLVPGTSLLVGGGKTGVLYVLNSTNLGKNNANDREGHLRRCGGNHRGGGECHSDHCKYTAA
jgi:hypothetical protein